jgi:hypothetical protein
LMRREDKHCAMTRSNFVRTKTIGTALFWKKARNFFSASDQNRESLQSMQYLEHISRFGNTLGAPQSHQMQ